MTFTNGNSIKFFYSAEGEKLKVEYVIGGTTTNTCYCANVVYENNNQKYLLNDEGYYDLASGARHYDPAIARWTTQDKFSEKYRSLSPYQYTASNPLKYIDINGDSIIKVNIIDYSNTISGNNTL